MLSRRSITLALVTLAHGLAAAPQADADPRRVGALTLRGKARIRTMAIAEDSAYLGLSENRRQEFVAVDLANGRKPRVSWSLELGTTVNDIAVVGRYAYAATSHDDAELMIVDLDARELAATFDVPGPEDAILAQRANDSFIWLGTAPKANADEALVLDVSVPLSPGVLTTRAANTDLRVPPPPSPLGQGYVTGERSWRAGAAPRAPR